LLPTAAPLIRARIAFSPTPDRHLLWFLAWQPPSSRQMSHLPPKPLPYLSSGPFLLINPFRPGVQSPVFWKSSYFASSFSCDHGPPSPFGETAPLLLWSRDGFFPTLSPERSGSDAILQVQGNRRSTAVPLSTITLDFLLRSFFIKSF